MQVGRIVSICSIIYLIFVFAFASGAIHSLTESGRLGERQFLLIPDRSAQTMTETVLTSFILFFGLAGVYLIHRSARPQTAKVQKMQFIGGFSIMAIALLAGFLIVEFKV